MKTFKNFCLTEWGLDPERTKAKFKTGAKYVGGKIIDHIINGIKKETGIGIGPGPIPKKIKKITPKKVPKQTFKK